MALRHEDISHAVSHALRHEPGKYGLRLDAQGWVEIDDLIAGLRGKGREWSAVDGVALTAMMATAKKQRFEVEGSRIRAFYGHSVEGHIERPSDTPPDRLFHGTSSEAWESIRIDGLRSMTRQSVHLSVDEETANLVGRRKSGAPVILMIDAKGAHESGIPFSLGNENVWVADGIPAEFILLAKTEP